MNENKNITETEINEPIKVVGVEAKVIQPNSFINGDCMEYMRTCPPNFFDLAIVDPPYGIGLAKMNMGIGKSEKASKIENRKWKAKDWDDSPPTPEYFEQLFRISKNQIIWGGNYFDLPAYKHYLLWDKQIPDGLSFADCEIAWTSFNKAPRIFRYSAYLDKAGKYHPTQKPLKLYKYILRGYAKAGDLILDTHVGSGNSLIACVELGYDYVGFEIDKEYYEMAKSRLGRATRKYELFEDV